MSRIQRHYSDYGSNNFFRSSLIGLSAQEIQEDLIRLDTYVKDFKLEIFKVSWYMRGGVTVNDLLDRYSFEDRELIYKVVAENFENTKNSGMPLI